MVVWEWPHPIRIYKIFCSYPLCSAILLLFLTNLWFLDESESARAGIHTRPSSRSRRGRELVAVARAPSSCALPNSRASILRHVQTEKRHAVTSPDCSRERAATSSERWQARSDQKCGLFPPVRRKTIAGKIIEGSIRKRKAYSYSVTHAQICQSYTCYWLSLISYSVVLRRYSLSKPCRHHLPACDGFPRLSLPRPE